MDAFREYCDEDKLDHFPRIEQYDTDSVVWEFDGLNTNFTDSKFKNKVIINIQQFIKIQSSMP